MNIFPIFTAKDASNALSQKNIENGNHTSASNSTSAPNTAMVATPSIMSWLQSFISPESSSPAHPAISMLAHQDPVKHKNMLEKVSTLTGGEISADEALNNPLKFEHASARIALGHPDQDVLEDLYLVHGHIKYMYRIGPSEAKDYLLGGSDKTARGGFGMTPTGEGDVDALDRFLDADPRTLPVHELVSGIETICTAEGYRSVNGDWAREPTQPRTRAQLIVQHCFEALTASNRTPPIGEVYQSRGSDDVTGTIADGINVPGGHFRVMDEPDTFLPGERPPLAPVSEYKYFRQFENPYLKKESWVGEAERKNIPVRAHASGTAPLTMSALDGHLSGATGNTAPSQTWGDRSMTRTDPVRLEQAAAMITLPTFVRASYHTNMETQAGIKHYHDMHGYLAHESDFPAPAKPRDLQKLANNNLLAITSDENLPGENFSARDVMNELQNEQYDRRKTQSRLVKQEQQQARHDARIATVNTTARRFIEE
ncbi:hypothetical protein EO087_03510 [Dyella sp. M7H15-1]|uniref:hypothetical protein n=1 Tax=Dyella sp. M7H15-1 TaxID=2501295 RepID=UPI001005084F|nr:hypothetical protein [Dyella sp. M7H15-1]QAU23173.1 hypothetical protein EO087_03510 [Dyella sp. M7H15-1]